MKTKKGPGGLELVDIEEPVPGPGQVLVEVSAAGICGSDVHIKHDTAFYTPPVVLGHEYSGTIVDVGPDVCGFAVGDRVVSPATAYCGRCCQCRTGHVNRCTAENKQILGVSLANGAFAKYLVVPEYIVHQIPDGVSMEEAALAEPTACVVHTIAECTKITPGDVVVVQGPGTTGLVAVQVSKAMGAAQVIVTGITADEWRMEIAREVGADMTIDVQKETAAVQKVKEITDGIGADVVVEASGSGAARKQAFDFVKTTGQIALIGIQGKPITLDLDLIVTKELHVLGTWGTIPSTWVTTLRMMASKRIDVKPLITHRVSLDEWEKGFELMESQKAIKVLFTDLD